MRSFYQFWGWQYPFPCVRERLHILSRRIPCLVVCSLRLQPTPSLLSHPLPKILAAEFATHPSLFFHLNTNAHQPLSLSQHHHQQQQSVDYNCSSSVSNLICHDGTTHIIEDNDEEEDHGVLILLQDPPLLSETEYEYIGALVSRESSFESRTIGASEAESLLRCARSDSVRWVFKMKACFGFGYQTAYLAVTYFDRFLVHRSIDEGKTWAWKLLSVACLSLAAKMEECRPRALSEYQLEGYQFSSNVIQRMELLVLDTLEWRMSSVTPFAYLGYFASKLECKSGRKDLFSRVIGFIFAIIEARNLLDCCPSAIAAAAILAASSDRLTKTSLQSKMSVISLPEPLETEHVFSCYNVMIHESQEEEQKPAKLLVSSDVSNNCASVNTSIDLNNATCFSVTSNKRRLQ